MIHLIEKEIKINPPLFSLKRDKLLSSLLSLILMVIMLGVSTYMFILLYQKFNTYNAGLSFSIIYLFALSILSYIYAVFSAKKTYFNDTDQALTSHRPIDTFSVILSKGAYLFLKILILEIALFSPHYIAFGIIANRLSSYYYMILVGLILHSLFTLALAMLFVPLIETIYRALKRHLVWQIIIIVFGVFLFTLVYSTVLNLFLNIINNSSLTYLFSDDNIVIVHRFASILYPDIFITKSLLTINYSLIFNYALIAFGFFILATLFLYFVYPKILIINSNNDRVQKAKPYRPHSPRFALFKKEFLLLIRQSDNLYNFTGLILIAPLLTFLVLNGLNEAFNNGLFYVYSSILPNFTNSIAILVFLLFSTLLTVSGANLLRCESRSVRIIKYLPYPAERQIYIKMVVLGIANFFSNFISLLILLIGKQIDVGLFFFLLMATVILNVSLIILLFRSEILNFRKTQNDNALASLLSLLIPLLIAAFNIVGSLTLGLNSFVLYLIDFGFLLIFSGGVFTYLKFRFAKDVASLEVIN